MDNETKQLLTDLRGQLEEGNKIKGAVQQLEQQVKALPGQFEKQLDSVRAAAWDGSGRYRGVFADEKQAKAFGLIALAIAGKSSDAQATLKKDFGDTYERAMASNPDASGGATVPIEFSDRMQSLFESYGVFERNAFRMPMSTGQMVFMKQTGDVTVYLLSENTAGSDSEPSFTNVTLTVQDWGSLTLIPKSLNEDSAAAIGELLARSIARAVAKQADKIGFVGDGTSTYFGIKGITPLLKEINGVDDGGGLVLGSGNLWSELTLTDFEALVGQLPSYAHDGAKFYCSRKFYFTVMAKLILGAGGTTAAEIEGRRMQQMLGYPVEFTEVMPTAEANSQVPVIFGDLSQSSTVGDRRMLTIESSTEAEFAKRQIAVLGTRRIAISNHDLGTATEAGPVVGLITADS